ncbi:MAG: class I SAM-dependent methyltransferase [Pirellula sp.]|jgi:trans-aconitate methyltransferase|nr:class I SAM-dependent methyltransferase [Pirellula sp.]
MSRIAIPIASSEFDAVAGDYEGALQQGLRVSGESAEYFATSRIQWLQQRLEKLGISVAGHTAIDFGCGTGNSIPHLQRFLEVKHIVGLDPSRESLRMASARFSDPNVEFHAPTDYHVCRDAGLAFCNGVFHHIEPADRHNALVQIRTYMKPGAVFAYWENNPWNPGTRYIMKRIPFDKDAIPISIPESHRLLRNAGFQILSTDSCFYFPRMLHWLRWMEPWLCKIPLGAQYLVIAQNPPPAMA